MPKLGRMWDPEIGRWVDDRRQSCVDRLVAYFSAGNGPAGVPAGARCCDLWCFSRGLERLQFDSLDEAGGAG